MRVAAPTPLRRALARLRERGESLRVEEVARVLAAAPAPVAPELARRIVAAALGCSPDALPDRVAPQRLRSAEEAELADVPLEVARFAVVDLETTGLSPERCHILEIGAVRVAGLRRGDRFASLVRPPGRVPAGIARLTGIRDEHVVDAPTPRRALRSFRRWLGRGAPAPFVAHNASFDARFVARALSEHGLPPYRAPVLCTRRLARRLLPDLGRYDLDHLCAHFRIANAARHRGPGDADATARALIELLDVARVRHRMRTVGDLLDLQEQAPARRKRRRR